MIAVRLRPRGEALAPAALLAHGDAARRLAARLLRHPTPGRWSGVAAPGLLVLLGDDLPWVDGVRYLGREPDAPSLLVPTTQAPDVPAPLVERHLVAAGLRAPIVLCDAPAILLSAAEARPISRTALERWLAAPLPPHTVDCIQYTVDSEPGEQ